MSDPPLAVAEPLASPHRLVRASAGTGKTYRLTNQYLALLARGEPAAQLVAVTFTRKAAGEILGRILTQLARAASSDERARELAQELRVDWPATIDPRRRFQELLRELCDSLHRLSVSTLDSFFHRLVSSFRLELGLPMGVVLAASTDLRVRRLRERALDAVLDRLAEPDLDHLLELLDQLNERHARRSVARDLDRVFVVLHDVYRAAPERATWDRLEVPPAPSAAALEEAFDYLSCAAASPDTTKTILRGLRPNLSLAEAGEWEEFFSKGLAKPLAQQPPVPEYSRSRIPEPMVEALQVLIAQARATLLEGVASRTRATHRVLELFDEAFERLRSRESVLLFSDLAFKLTHELPMFDAERLAEIYYRLDGRVGHLLLDEFQDTSLDQWHALAPFAAEIAAHGDGSRTFFCVGDPKQAIYGWRGGCSELFDEVADGLRLPAHATEDLLTSYRSSQVVLDAVNQVFGALDEAPVLERYDAVTAEWRATFHDHETARPELPGYVELVTSLAPGDEPDPDDVDADDGHPDAHVQEDEGEATPTSLHEQSAARLITRLARGTPGRSIGVLVQTNQAVRRMLDLLRAQGLEASGEGGTPIVDDPAVSLVMSALILADHPADSAAAFHVARSPLAERVGLGSWRPEDAALAASAIRTGITAHGLAPVLADWARHLASWSDRRGAVRLAQLIELADRYEPRAGLRTSEFVDFVCGTPLEEPNPGALRVMTIHKAKGLEFDTVVLCQLDRQLLRVHDHLVYVEREAPTAPIDAVYRAARKIVREQSEQLEGAYEQELRRRLWDDLSGLYVAMTRARSALHMVVKPRGANKDGSPRKDVLCYASILRQTMAPDIEPKVTAKPRQTLYRHGDEASLLSGAGSGEAATVDVVPEPERHGEVRKSAGGESRPRWLPVVRPSQLASRAQGVRLSELLQPESSVHRLRGRLLHAWLAEIEWLGDGKGGRRAMPSEARLFEIAERVAPQASASWRDRLLIEWQRALDRPAIAELLHRPEKRRGEVAEVWSERPFALVVDGRLVRGTFDRVVVYRRASDSLSAVGADLLDFKSDRIGVGGGKNSSSVVTVAEGYRQQIEAYRDALATMLGVLPTAVRARLAFLDSGEVVTV